MTFEPIVTYGNVLTALSMIVGMAVFIVSTIRRIDRIQSTQVEHGKTLEHIKTELGNGMPGRFMLSRECGAVHTALMDRLERWDELNRENWETLDTRANAHSESLKTMALQLAVIAERIRDH